MAHRLETIPLKIVILGDGACGKSALLLAYTTKGFNDTYIPTVVDTYEVVMGLGEKKQLKLTVLDTAGQEDFANIRAIAIKGADVGILCYSVDNVNSLDNARTNWVPEVREEDATLQFVLVGNKADMFEKGEPEHVSYSQAKKVAKKIKAFASIQCSAKQFGMTEGSTGKVDKVFRAAIKCGLIKKGVISRPTCTVL